jgi:hypothetical protein
LVIRTHHLVTNSYHLSLQKQENKIVLYFGDFDPSGLDIANSIYKRLGEQDVDATFNRVALNQKQIIKYSLIPNPTKKADTRTPRFIEQNGDKCYELDALPPDVLQRIIEDSIKSYINPQKLKEWKDGLGKNRRLVYKRLRKKLSKLK